MNSDINSCSYSAEEHVLQRLCPICDFDRGASLLKQRFASMTNGLSVTGYEVVACSRCGFVFADGILTQCELDEYYREMSKYDYQGISREGPDYDVGRFERIAGLIERQIPDHSIKILEIGCATGRLLRVLKDSGYSRVQGVDPAPSAAEIGLRQYGIQIMTSSIFDLNLAPCSYDLVILIGVLEHVSDLGRAVLGINDLLKSGGKVLVGVPDAAALAQAENAPFQEFSVEHINFFGPISLANLTDRYGFREIFQSRVLELLGPHITTPALYSLFRKGGPASQDVLHKKDEQSQKGIRSYIDKSRKADRLITSKITDLAESGNPIIVWGTGSHTLRLLAESHLARANIVAFVDSNPHYHGKRLNGVPIVSPAQLKQMPDPILISSHQFQSEIERQLKNELRLCNQLIKLYD